MTEQVALCDQVVDVAVLSEVDKGRHVDRPGLAVPVDGCAKGERLADGGLTVGEG